MFEHKSLSREESHRVLLNIADGKYNDSQLSAFMTVYLMRSITLDELTGFRDAILERRNPVDFGDIKAIDIVGTGGDGKNTFNISTASCFVVAGTGRKVVKHGNYGASSIRELPTCSSSMASDSLPTLTVSTALSPTAVYVISTLRFSARHSRAWGRCEKHLEYARSSTCSAHLSIRSCPNISCSEYITSSSYASTIT